jgi:hypothetical protein
MALSKITDASVTNSTLTTTKLATPNLGRRNLVINGAMTIDQRNGGVSYAQINGAYSLDRFRGNSYDGGAATGKFTVIQSSTAPNDFSHSLLFTSSAATSDAANNIFNIEQLIEGFNTAHINYGSSSAQTITLSFYVRSSLTGTFGGALKNSARDRNYPFTYTINSANTFERKVITISGDTTGTWIGSTNGMGLWVSFGLGVGSNYAGSAGAWAAGDKFSASGATSVVGTSGATWYITGVQLEVGSAATPFEHRSYGEELALCQRYCQVVGGESSYNQVGFGFNYSTARSDVKYLPPIPFRTIPSLTISGSWSSSDGSSGATVSSFTLASSQSSTYLIEFQANVSGVTAGKFVRIEATNSTSSTATFDAEL